MFVNEFCAETYSQRIKGETSNDYNDRLIRRAVKYYNDKGLLYNTGCLLITNDKLNAEAAKEDKIDAVRLKLYVENVLPEIMDKVAGANEEGIEIDRNINYPPHMALSQVG